MITISKNTIRWECAELVNVAFSSAKAHGRISLFTYKRTIQYVTPKITIGYQSVRALATVVNSIAATERLKRENVRRTNVDSAFSAWKILSGPSDWENYSMGKEGTEKYRTQNLPDTPCPGLYELGVYMLLPRPTRKSRKITSSSVIVVYLGQSENLRARTEQYGRNGAHLESSCGLFSDTFSKGYAIVYRCASMESKRDAEELEDELLRKYDYAWNKRRNGDRRPDDIHRKLEPCTPKSQFPLVNWFQQNNSVTRFDNKGIFSRINFGITNLQPKKVGRGSSEHSTSICGAVTANGSVCVKPPVPGRKRCGEHKGMNKTGGINAPNITRADQSQRSNKSRVTRKPYARERPINESLCSYLWSYFRRWFSK